MTTISEIDLIKPATAATRTNGQTGPRTEAGKAKSSRNSIRTGLCAARDFVRPEEEEEYAKTLIRLMDELTPENSVEQTFATEIMGATWRLRRCRLVEESFGLIEDLNSDPMIDERTEKQQKSVDRARAQSHLILRRSLDELRKLQKVRTIQDLKPAPQQSEPNAGPPNMNSFCTPAGPVSELPSTKPVATATTRSSPKIPPGTPPAPAVPAQNTKNAVEVRPRRP